MVRRPRFRIWVKGSPRSFQGTRASAEYRKSIADAVRSAVSAPTRSKRIDVEIYFDAPHLSKADVDNVVKPILDALEGIVYDNDRQVRSVRAVAYPKDHVRETGWTSPETLSRFSEGQFLIDIYEGLALAGFGPGVDP